MTTQIPLSDFQKGSIENPYREFVFTVADDDRYTINYDFTFWRMLELSNATGVSLIIGDSGAPTSIVGAGVAQESYKAVVKRITIVNESGGTITGRLALAIGQIYDDRLNLSGAINVAVPTNYTSTADYTVPTASASQVVAADTNRHELHLRADIGNVNPIRIGDSNVSATRGITLYPGEVYVINSEAAVYAYSPSASQILQICEVKS